MTDAPPPSDGSAPPLSGLRVLELGSFIAGPFAGQLLGDLGADVTKIEPPGAGDPMRRWGVTVDGAGLWWPAIARNKESVAIDLRTDRGPRARRRSRRAGRRRHRELQAGHPRPVGSRLRDPRTRNPGVIIVHVSGFGQDGPRAHEPGFGAIGEAMGGLRHTTGDPDRPPARAGISLGDALAALFAVIGTLAAVTERHRWDAGRRSTSRSTRRSWR